MGTKCILGCSLDDGTRLHSFPEDPVRREKWLSVLGVEPVRRKVYICSKHFSPGYIFGNKTSRYAIPDRNLTKVEQPKAQKQTVRNDATRSFSRTQKQTIETKAKATASNGSDGSDGKILKTVLPTRTLSLRNRTFQYEIPNRKQTQVETNRIQKQTTTNDTRCSSETSSATECSDTETKATKASGRVGKTLPPVMPTRTLNTKNRKKFYRQIIPRKISLAIKQRQQPTILFPKDDVADIADIQYPEEDVVEEVVETTQNSIPEIPIKVEDFQMSLGTAKGTILKGRYVQLKDYLVVSYTTPAKLKLTQKIERLGKRCDEQAKEIKQIKAQNLRLSKEILKYKKLYWSLNKKPKTKFRKLRKSLLVY